jgi:uncharacterized membrane protein
MAASTTMNNSCCRSRALEPFEAILFCCVIVTWHQDIVQDKPAPSCRLPRSNTHGSIHRPEGGCSMRGYLVDILAVGFFVLEWTVYAITLEHTAYGRDSLSARMNVYREVWMRRMLDREARMVDMQIMAALQNGTAFFASTSLLAVGGGLALLRSTSEALAVLSALPIDISPTPALWEIKCVGLILIFIYAFFKFAWAYRLFNYVAILLGAMPPAKQRDTPEAEAHVMRTTRLFEAAGRHFNRGQRAFFFALGYLGWFVSPWVLFATTAAVVIVTWRRQFASNAWSAMGS